MTKIAIDIDCDGVYCGDCYFNYPSVNNIWYCGAWHNEYGQSQELEYETINSDFLGDCKRCQQCIEAEIKSTSES